MTNLAKQHDNEYKALLKVVSPVTTVEVVAEDVNGNYAHLTKKLKVENRFNNFFSSLWKDIHHFLEAK